MAIYSEIIHFIAREKSVYVPLAPNKYNCLRLPLVMGITRGKYKYVSCTCVATTASAAVAE